MAAAAFAVMESVKPVAARSGAHCYFEPDEFADGTTPVVMMGSGPVISVATGLTASVHSNSPFSVAFGGDCSFVRIVAS